MNKNRQEPIRPLCPIFGECGGCAYQDISYQEELKIKNDQLRKLFNDNFSFPSKVFHPIVSSPKEYYYRHRLDLKFIRTKDGRELIGFTPKSGRGIVVAEGCSIAQKEISDFFPSLRRSVQEEKFLKYRLGNICVRTSDDGRVFWGGMGRKSLRLSEDQYFWTEIEGRKIFYSLDTFFQANLSILPSLFKVLKNLPVWEKETTLYDLYGGVGLFSVGLSDKAKKVILIEECLASVEVAQYNKKYHQLDSLNIIVGRVEDELSEICDREKQPSENVVAIVDPPRAGLALRAVELLNKTRAINTLLYLSCSPESLVRDLKLFVGSHWKVESVIPFDFFPRTKHLETLVVMRLC